jgi:hypothetical protein
MSEPDLRSVRGRVVRPTDAEYTERSQAHQLAVQQRPAAVVEATTVDDLRAVLLAARGAGLTVATQALGHGASEDLAGSILVRLGAFDRIELDERAATAVVGAGVTAGALAARLAGTGLVPAMGTSPDVSLVPLVLGGGHGWLARQVGLSAQTVRRVELLRPDGEHAWVDDESDPDLMRVLRGAGGLVGIVTAVEVDLVRAPALTAGTATFPLESGPATWRAVRDADLPDSLNVFLSSVRMPDAPFLPEAVRGRSWFSVQALSLDGDLGVLDPGIVGGATASAFGPIDVPEIAAITNDPRDPGASTVVGAVLSALPDEAIDAVLGWHASEAGGRVVLLGARLLGGALDRESRGSVASLAGGQWLLSGVLPIPPGADPGAAQAAAAELLELVRPWTLPGLPPTFLAAHQGLDVALSPEALSLVRATRERLDAHVVRPVRFTDD